MKVHEEIWQCKPRLLETIRGKRKVEENDDVPELNHAHFSLVSYFFWVS